MIDANGQRVIAFASAMRNASRIGTYVDTVLDMFQSRAWRRYATAVGAEQWRPHEFDYFLIACGAEYRDVAQLLTWKKAKAIEIAPAMGGDARRTRRSLEKASDAWHSPTGMSLIELARRQGWLRSDWKAPTLLVAPVSQYVRTLAKDTPPAGRGRAEYYRTRTLDLIAERRRVLNAEAARLRTRYSVEELRYLRERLRRSGAGRPRLNGPVSRQTAWARRHAERQTIN